MGVDLGKHHDHSVVSVVTREKNILKLVHLKRFPLKTAYASVIGYVKTLGDRWSSILYVIALMEGIQRIREMNLEDVEKWCQKHKI